MELKVEQPSADLLKVKMKLSDLDIKLSFNIQLIMADDIDSICEARNSATTEQLCLLSTNNVAILKDVQVQTGANLGPAALIAKYNAHPLVSKGKYPKINRYVTVTQSVVEGVVLSGDAFKYFN